MSVSRTRRSKALVRADKASTPKRGRTFAGVPVRGGRLLHGAVQRGEGSPEESVELMQLMTVFASEMVRNTVSSDVIYLALRATFSKVDPSAETRQKFVEAVGLEHSQRRWPKGF